MDRISKEHRSWNMSRIRSKNTGPEMRLRALLRPLGFRMRYNVKTLPGKPDIVIPSIKTVIFVHGCFWHRHPRCRYATTPKTRKAFWQAKFAANVARFAKVRKELRRLGWCVKVIWQCQIVSRG